MRLDYSVAIRTLGTAGNKYQILLESLAKQSVSPKHIFVYLPFNSNVPIETIGTETIVRCDRGMVTQRSQQYEEIDTEWILFCDDDLYLPPDFMNTLFHGLDQYQADCIIPNVYPQEGLSSMQKIMTYVYNGVEPRKDDGWALKISRNGAYSYNNNPQKKILPTMSGPFACFLCRKSVFKSIHFEDERWLEQFSFASYDDQLCFHKMNVMGYKVLLHYSTGLIHLDAKAGKRPDLSKKMYFKKKLQYVVWYRTIYSLAAPDDRWKCRVSFGWRNFIGIFALIVDVIRFRRMAFILDYFKGLRDGKRYVQSAAYREIPAFDAYKKCG